MTYEKAIRKQSNKGYRGSSEYWSKVRDLKRIYLTDLQVFALANKEDTITFHKAIIICSLLKSTPKNHSLGCHMAIIKAAEKQIQLWLDN